MFLFCKRFGYLGFFLCAVPDVMNYDTILTGVLIRTLFRWTVVHFCFVIVQHLGFPTTTSCKSLSLALLSRLASTSPSISITSDVLISSASGEMDAGSVNLGSVREDVTGCCIDATISPLDVRSSGGCCTVASFANPVNTPTTMVVPNLSPLPLP